MNNYVKFVIVFLVTLVPVYLLVAVFKSNDAAIMFSPFFTLAAMVFAREYCERRWDDQNVLNLFIQGAMSIPLLARGIFGLLTIVWVILVADWIKGTAVVLPA